MQVISLSILCNQVATFMTQSPRKQVKHKIVEISATKHPANNPAASVPLLVKQVHKTQTTCLCPTVPSDITISSRALLRELEVHDSATALENLSLSLSALQIVNSDLPEKPKKLDKILVHLGSNFVHKETETETEILSCLSKCLDTLSLHNEKLLTQRTKNRSAKK